MAHLVALWNHEVSESVHVPDQTEVVNTYFKLTGGPDAGLNESDVLNKWTRTKLYGQTIAAYAPVNHLTIEELQQGTAFFGGLMLGIACPDSAQQQFAAGEPWTVVPGAQVEGGHCIIACGYDHQYLYCATWGGVAPVSWPFVQKYCDEAWAVISEAFVLAKRGPLLDLDSLRADITRL